MGTGAEFIVPLALGVGGAGLNYYNGQQTEKRQENELARQIQQRSRLQDQADQSINKLLAQRAVSDSEPERESTASQYLDRVRMAQGAATSGLGQRGAVSDAYQQSAQDAALGIGSYGDAAANLMARVDAPMLQRDRESVENAQLGSDLGRLSRKSQGQDYLSQLRLQGIRRNPWLDAASQGLSGAAMATAGSMGSQGGAGSMANFGSEAGTWFNNPSLWGR